MNQTTTGDQNLPRVARSASGDFVVVWMGNGPGDDHGVFARRYDASGNPKGNEFLVNDANTTSDQSQPDVAMDAAGDFVVVWQSFQNGSDYNIFDRVYNADGTARTAGAITSNSYATHDQKNPSVAMDANGNYVVVWSGEGSGDTAGIFGQRFTSAGSATGSPFRANTTTSGTQELAKVAMDANGNFVVVWTDDDQEGTGNAGVYGQRFTSAGAASGSEFHVNVSTTGPQDFPDVAMCATGSFIVSWHSFDGSNHNALFSRYDASGSRIGTEVQANPADGNHADIPQVAMDALCDYAIAWPTQFSGGDWDIRASLYTQGGNHVGTNAFEAVSQASGSFQDFSAVAMDADGDMVFAFESTPQDGDSYGVFVRQYSGPENVDLGVALTDSADPVAAGAAMTYTAAVTNHHATVAPTGTANLDAWYQSTGVANGITATFTAPSGAGSISGSGTNWSCSGSSTLACAFSGNLAPGASTTLTLSLNATASGGAASASIAVDGGQEDLSSTNNSATEGTTVTPPPDTTPDAFSFTDQSGLERSTVATSNTVTISGIDHDAAISVTGGSYSIGCTAAFTTSAGTIASGQAVCVRQTSSASFSTPTDTVLTVGGVSDTFTVTTRAGSTTPAAFAFVDQTGAATAASATSNTVTISGNEVAAPISVSGGEYSIGCTTTFTSAAGTIAPGQTVCLRLTTSANASTLSSATLTVGGVSDTWNVTTAAATPASGGGGGGAFGCPALLLLGLAGALRRRRQ